MSNMNQKKVSSIVKTETKKMLDNGHTVEQIAKRFIISVQYAQKIVDEIETEEYIKKAVNSIRKLETYISAKKAYENNQAKLCRNCRWKPCVGAPVCYRKIIDREK